jgi:accessory colonization factor AcfA
MKKVLIATSIATSLLIALPAVSSPYVGLEIGAPVLSGDIETEYAGEQLKAEAKDAVFSAFVGYQFNNAWGVELGYRQYEMEDSASKDTPEGSDWTKEEEWESNIDAKQISLMPTYSYHINEDWKLKAGIGLTYTQYDQKLEYSSELEHNTNDTEKDYTSNSVSDDNNQWGGIASVGVEYNIYSNFTVGASAKYQADDYSDALFLNLSTAYYF